MRVFAHHSENIILNSTKIAFFPFVKEDTRRLFKILLPLRFLVPLIIFQTPFYHFPTLLNFLIHMFDAFLGFFLRQKLYMFHTTPKKKKKSPNLLSRCLHVRLWCAMWSFVMVILHISQTTFSLTWSQSFCLYS